MTYLAGNIEKFTFKISGIDVPLRLVSFSGEEGMSQPFNVSLDVAVDNASLDFDAIELWVKRVY